jgi:hypothetical protein
MANYLLKDFIETCGDDNMKKSLPTAIKFIQSYKKILSKDEMEDINQDIIIILLETKKEYDSSKGSFVTLFDWKLKNLRRQLITKYTGIKISSDHLCKMKNENKHIFINMVGYEEEN